MRLIDGDALEERFQSLAYDDWNQGVTTSWADAYRECADMVYEQTTIEPERKKGAWTNNNACPFCGFQPWYERDIHTLSYCPNCGADMREGEQE